MVCLLTYNDITNIKDIISIYQKTLNEEPENSCGKNDLVSLQDIEEGYYMEPSSGPNASCKFSCIYSNMEYNSCLVLGCVRRGGVEEFGFMQSNTSFSTSQLQDKHL